ncbi:MAG: UDP-3-O-(3-hydroxymyristoyl)glucosamine N-acyltransferase [Bacteroidota bacterium]
MEFTARQIADLLGGLIEGDPESRVSALSKIEEGKPGSLSFLANPAYTPHIYTTEASIVIIGKDLQLEKPVGPTLIRVDDAYASFATLLEMYDTVRKNKSGIDPQVFIHPDARLGQDVYIGAFAYIGKDAILGDRAKIYPGCYVGENTKIGNDTTLFAGVIVYSDCSIGQDVRIHAGAIIGSDGFGFAPADGGYKKVAQIGNVIIEDHVEIGAGTTIDRATLGSTIIRKGVKLDNLIQIAHNVEIGENTVIAAQTGVAGSTRIGKNCMIGGQVGIVGHIQIADGTRIAAQSGIGSSTSENEILQGSPAFPIGEFKRSYIHFRKLPGLEQEVRTLKQKLKELGSENS